MHPVAGILIADEVGLRETVVGMGFIAFIANAVILRESKVQLPPCIGKLYFCSDHYILLQL
jgi:hypothetical protein